MKTRRGEQLRTWKRLTLGSEDFARLPDELDRRICLMMGAAATALRTSYYAGYSSYSDSDRKFGGGEIAVEARPVLLPLLFQSGRFLVRRWQGSTAPTPLAWDDGPLWQLSLALRPAARSSTTLELELRRGDQRRAIDDQVVVLLGPPTYVLIDDKLS
ncbi:MAG: hypothetical protein HZB38_06585, partial [Planctomycetes bacterium]|nr:hypothetical protein [Planctomycetota bacterium]